MDSRYLQHRTSKPSSGLATQTFAHPGLEAAFLTFQARRGRWTSCILYILFAAMWASLWLRARASLDAPYTGHARRLLLVAAVCYAEMLAQVAIAVWNFTRAQFFWSERLRAAVAEMNIVCTMFVVIMLEGDTKDVLFAHPVLAALVQAMLIVFSDLRTITCWPLYIHASVAFVFSEMGLHMHGFRPGTALAHTSEVVAGLATAMFVSHRLEVQARCQFLAQQSLPPRAAIGSFWATRLQPAD